jgi:hypothetical protein
VHRPTVSRRASAVASSNVSGYNTVMSVCTSDTTPVPSVERYKLHLKVNFETKFSLHSLKG